jgi:curved DNA-binding protein CbpA
MKTTYFNDCKNLDEVKRRYKELALKHHPDRGGDTRIMQDINNAYDAIKKNPFFKFYKEKEESQQDYVQFPDIISQIIGMKDIVIELCGNWLWISGNTYKHRRELKQYGFLFADKKKLWYWRPNDYKSANQEPRSMEYIRSKYGSDVYQTPNTPELETSDEQKK